MQERPPQPANVIISEILNAVGVGDFSNENLMWKRLDKEEAICDNGGVIGMVVLVTVGERAWWRPLQSKTGNSPLS